METSIDFTWTGKRTRVESCICGARRYLRVRECRGIEVKDEQGLEQLERELEPRTLVTDGRNEGSSGRTRMQD